MTTSTITRKQVPVKDRIQSTAKLFGKHFMDIEGLVYDISGHFAVNSYWQFYLLDNGGFLEDNFSLKNSNIDEITLI